MANIANSLQPAPLLPYIYIGRAKLRRFAARFFVCTENTTAPHTHSVLWGWRSVHHQNTKDASTNSASACMVFSNSAPYNKKRRRRLRRRRHINIVLLRRVRAATHTCKLCGGAYAPPTYNNKKLRHVPRRSQSTRC